MRSLTADLFFLQRDASYENIVFLVDSRKDMLASAGLDLEAGSISIKCHAP